VSLPHIRYSKTKAKPTARALAGLNPIVLVLYGSGGGGLPAISIQADKSKRVVHFSSFYNAINIFTSEKICLLS
jgi:hypothetical protein